MSNSRVLSEDIEKQLNNLHVLVRSLTDIDQVFPKISRSEWDSLFNQVRELETVFKNLENADEAKKLEHVSAIYRISNQIKMQLDKISENDFELSIEIDAPGAKRKNIPIKKHLSSALENLRSKVPADILYSPEDLELQMMLVAVQDTILDISSRKPKSLDAVVIQHSPELKSSLRNFLKEALQAKADIGNRNHDNSEQYKNEMKLLAEECREFFDLYKNGHETIKTLETSKDPVAKAEALKTFKTKVEEYENKNRPKVWKQLTHAALVAAGALLGCVIGAAIGLTVGALAVGGAGSVIPVFGNIGGAIAGGSAGAVIGAIKGAGLGVVIATAAATSILGMAGGVAAHKLDSKRAMFTQPKKDLSQVVDKAERENRPGKQQR